MPKQEVNINVDETNKLRMELNEVRLMFTAKSAFAIYSKGIDVELAPIKETLAAADIGALKDENIKPITKGESFSINDIEIHMTIEIFDDYAHHPTEVKVTLEASRQRYPDKKIIAIFKPHRASRVLYFSEQFAQALSLADEIYLLDFTSIDDKQDGTDIDITYLAKTIPNSTILSEDKKGAEILAKHKDECLVFMSSKDIYNIANWVKELI